MHTLINIPGNWSLTCVGSASKPNPGLRQYCKADLQSSVSEQVPSPKSTTSKNFRSDLAWLTERLNCTIETDFSFFMMTKKINYALVSWIRDQTS